MIRPILIGLTGGIGSGKSTAATLLARRGAAIIDADLLSRSLTSIGGAAIAPIRTAFGEHFIDSNGALNREKMRAHVFTQPGARQRLEAILHPMIRRLSDQQTQTAIIAACPCIVYDVPLLVESHTWRQRVDHVLVIDCTPETQIFRVMARNGLSRAEVEQIVVSQAPRQQRLSAADTVLYNNTLSLNLLEDEVNDLSPRFGLSFLQSPTPL